MNQFQKIQQEMQEKKKQDSLFSLYPEERQVFNEFALQAGFNNQYGKGNASAFLSATIQELGGRIVRKKY